MNASTLVQKLWNYCNVLRDDGMGYGDDVEQLTFLLSGLWCLPYVDPRYQKSRDSAFLLNCDA